MIRRLAPALALAMLAACSGPGVKPDAPVDSHGRATSRTSAAGSRTPTQIRAPAAARPDRPGEYTAGGLYRPGVPDNAPSEPPDLSALVEPEPREEPRARYGNRSPYTVLGKVYRVMDDADGYVERGIASWYGEKFHGRATSSFEPYDMYAFSAAHRTLPLPTYARVTNLENGRSVVVRVNDRGPFHADRLIDLSYAAAVRLDMLRRGTARVEVRALTSGRGEPQAPIVVEASKPRPTAASGTAWVQVASFGERDNARRLARRLEDAGLGRVRVVRAKVGGGRVFRVRIGPLADRAIAQQIAAEVHSRGYGQPSVVAE